MNNKHCWKYLYFLVNLCITLVSWWNKHERIKRFWNQMISMPIKLRPAIYPSLKSLRFTWRSVGSTLSSWSLVSLLSIISTDAISWDSTVSFLSRVSWNSIAAWGTYWSLSPLFSLISHIIKGKEVLCSDSSPYHLVRLIALYHYRFAIFSMDSFQASNTEDIENWKTEKGSTCIASILLRTLSKATKVYV